MEARYPDTPPDGGAIADPIPHLTMARTPPAASLDDVACEVFAAISPQLPLACEVREVALALERSDRWSIGERFPLASG